MTSNRREKDAHHCEKSLLKFVFLIKRKTFQVHLITLTLKNISVACCFKKTNHNSKMTWTDASEASNRRKSAEKKNVFGRNFRVCLDLRLKRSAVFEQRRRNEA